ncbi:hypothetical protein Francci3_4448 [Frankia casuarinae]|uniref:Uncharacterized protein n=1 Tax=Frankia casuarinae (strain DSM 45818 / CECT 9043 / HFP020203 / CcI3) TaxID=106370 RepID=Q2J4J8_FRACC|nr:hypothetical protein Francci3_4448 [Frankia casuarinae]
MRRKVRARSPVEPAHRYPELRRDSAHKKNRREPEHREKPDRPVTAFFVLARRGRTGTATSPDRPAATQRTPTTVTDNRDRGPPLSYLVVLSIDHGRGAAGAQWLPVRRRGYRGPVTQPFTTSHHGSRRRVGRMVQRRVHLARTHENNTGSC